MKHFDPFEEDKHLMSAGQVADYSFVFHKWTPSQDCPSSTDWREIGDEIEFQAIVRAIRGELRVTVRKPRLETKAGKAKYTADVRKELLAALAPMETN